MTPDVAVFALLVAAVGVIGVVIGLAVAPRLTRWTERAGDDDPDGGTSTGGGVDD